MRKLSLLRTMLVVGLVIGLAGSAGFVGIAATDSQNVGLERTDGGYTLNVTSNDIDIVDFDPTDSASLDGENTVLEVKSTKAGNNTWELSVHSVNLISSPDGANSSAITSAFGYSVDETSLHNRLSSPTDAETVEGENGEFTGIIYDYSWAGMASGGNAAGSGAAADMPDGNYTLAVTFEISAA